MNVEYYSDVDFDDMPVFYGYGKSTWVGDSVSDTEFSSSTSDESCDESSVACTDDPGIIELLCPILREFSSEILPKILEFVDRASLHMLGMTCRTAYAKTLSRCEPLELLIYAAKNDHLEMFLLISGGKFVYAGLHGYRLGLHTPPADLIVWSTATNVRRWIRAGVKLSSNASIRAYNDRRIDILRVLVEENQDIDPWINETSILNADFNTLRALGNRANFRVRIVLPSYADIICMKSYEPTARMLEFLYIIFGYNSYYDNDSESYFDDRVELMESLTLTELIWCTLIGGKVEVFEWAQARGLVSTGMVYKLAADEQLTCIAERADKMGIHTYANMNRC